MSDNRQEKDPTVLCSEQLFQFAIDRADMRVILDALPLGTPEKRSTLEYEIQLLRIISVGWGLSFFLEDETLKTRLGQQYWEKIRNFSVTLSSSASLTVGSDIDYFEIIKRRLSTYVGALDGADNAPDPSAAIGPTFADACGDKNDALAILAGTKMFAHTIMAVREYLEETVFQQATDAHRP